MALKGKSTPRAGGPSRFANLKVLVVDDDSDIRDLIVQAIRRDGGEAFEAGDGLEALKVLDHSHVDVIVTDVRMPHCDGLELLRRVQARSKKMPGFVIMTGYKDVPMGDIIALGGQEILIKPFEAPEVMRCIDRSMRTTRWVG